MTDQLFKDAARIFRNLNMTGDCWIWTKALTRDGYGKVTVGSRARGTERTPPVHRWVYEYVVEPIPEGLQIDHLCGVRSCANPAHLEPVTLAVNQSRKRKKREPQDFCMSGRHLLAIHARHANSGKRYCGTCSDERRGIVRNAEREMA